MKIETGEPPAEGRYLVFVRSPARDWLAPLIMSYYTGRWDCRDKVLAWCGPIPPMRVDALQVFDL